MSKDNSRIHYSPQSVLTVSGREAIVAGVETKGVLSTFNSDNRGENSRLEGQTFVIWGKSDPDKTCSAKHSYSLIVSNESPYYCSNQNTKKCWLNFFGVVVLEEEGGIGIDGENCFYLSYGGLLELRDLCEVIT
ncbi:hypothetical protein H5410_001250 [Solanum commersonii]|uniref:Uncharacterized protein n=1 Tax=Solanum commersonii TaxID=4109 RepID=A0A9J6AY54_SOLCO|nr:hypothetical protein H5410_001250 [Solanum commersonii]